MLDYSKGGNKKGGSDPADAATEKMLKDIEKQITREYEQAEKEIQIKLDDYLRRFRVKDELKKKALDNGLISEQEYKQWRLGQVMMGKRWEEMRDTIAKDLTNADQIARSIAFGHMPEVYAINHDYATFQIEKASLLDTSYTLYDRQAMEQLMKDNDQTFIPAPGRKVTQAINEGKAMAWNRRQVQSAMMQSLLQGESIPDIATRLAKTVGESDRKAAIRNARTMTTGIENAGRMAGYKRANDMGIETQKQWLATLDSRTRHWHSSLDGVKVDNDKPFTNEYGDIMYPGDPVANPSNIFNCRCTLIASIKGFERDVSDMGLRHDDNLGDMTYDEWRAGHYDQTSDPITKQDDIAETMQRIYNAEYSSYKNLTGGNDDGIINLDDGIKASSISADSVAITTLNDEDRAKIINEAIHAEKPFYAEDLRNVYKMSNVQPKEGCYEVLLHGAPNCTEYEKKYILNNETLYYIISGRADWKGQNIRLISCSTGKANENGKCVAQYLADHLGVNVYAPIDAVKIHRNGKLTVGDTDLSEEEGFRWFYPRR